MLKNILLLSAGALAIGGTMLLAGPASAQQPRMPKGGCPMMEDGGMGMGTGMMGRRMGGDRMANRGPMVEKRLAKLKSELEIKEGQTAAWDAYVKAVKSRADTMMSNRDAMMKTMASGTAVSRIDARLKMMDEMSTSLKAQRAALEALYATLDAGQKTKADQVLGMSGCMM